MKRKEGADILNKRLKVSQTSGLAQFFHGAGEKVRYDNEVKTEVEKTLRSRDNRNSDPGRSEDSGSGFECVGAGLAQQRRSGTKCSDVANSPRCQGCPI